MDYYYQLGDVKVNSVLLQLGKNNMPRTIPLAQSVYCWNSLLMTRITHVYNTMAIRPDDVPTGICTDCRSDA